MEWTVERSLSKERGAERLENVWASRASPAAVPKAPVASPVMRTDAGTPVVEELARAIEGAHDIVVAFTFLLAEPTIEAALVAAAKRGVRVYLLTAATTRLEQELRSDSEFERARLDEHKQMLDRLAGWVLVRSASSFHAKGILVDPARGGPAFLSTANLTREALTRNQELVVRLEEGEARRLLDVLRWAFWEAAEHEMAERGGLLAVEPLGEVRRPDDTGDVVSTLSRPGSLRETVLDLVSSAEREIVVACYGWAAVHPVVEALVGRARSGVRVRALARVRAAATPALSLLRAAGAEVVAHDWLHAKAVVVDDAQAIVMSANLEPRGLDEGFELGVRLRGARAAAVRGILAAWEAEAPWRLERDVELRALSGAVRVLEGKDLVARTVEATRDVALPDVVATSADRLEDAPPPPMPEARRWPLAHVVRFRWRAKPPVLWAGARPVQEPRGPAPGGPGPWLFRDSGNRIVVGILSPDQLEEAKRLRDRYRAAAIVLVPEPPKSSSRAGAR